MSAIQLPRPFNIDPNALATDAANGDRLVFTPWFVVLDPYVNLDVASVPNYQLDRAAVGLTLIRDETIREKLLHRYRGLAERIQLFADLRAEMGRANVGESLPGATELGQIADSVQRLSQQYAGILRAHQGENDPAAKSALAALAAAVAATQNATGHAAPRAAYRLQSGAGAGTTTGPGTGPGTGTGSGMGSYGTSSPGNVLPPDAIAALLSPELGFLFLDRTRIRPLGFGLGEHIQSLSLAPGEEVTLEVKSYSKREESFERSSEQERTFDVEMSSTLTTELNEGMTSEHSRNTGDTNTMGVNVGGNIDGITFNVGPTSSSTLAEANRDSSSDSTKTAQTASSKVAARNRALHKTVFRVVNETRFESNSKRVFRNPNANTPIDLQYFKVMQRLQLSHERYGVRLCWSPVLADPGAGLLARLEAVRQAIYLRASQAGAGPRPPQPQPVAGPQAPAAQIISDSFVANGFDPVWGGQRQDYTVTLLAPNGLQWDRNATEVTNSVTLSFTGRRPAGASATAVSPTPAGVLVVVHVGIEDNANPFKPQYWEGRGSAVVTVSARFEPAMAPVAAADDSYQKAMAAWRDAIAAWEALDRQAKAEAKAAADEEWAAVLKKALDEANPLQEVIGGIMRSLPGFTHSIREVDFLEDVFDWKNAGIRLYANWWSAQELRDPTRPADSFVNASWARLYLPVKVGAEARALRWIYDQVMVGAGSASTEALITLLTTDLDAYRTASFGDVSEIVLGALTGGCPAVSRPFLCLGTWEELLPTDGTHLEVMQATSTAADDHGRAALEDADALRDAQVEGVARDNALRQKAEADGLGQVATTIALNVGADPAV